jgi:hypothetical protein
MPLDAPLSAKRISMEGKIANLREPDRIWAIGATHGRYGALCALHEALSTRLRPGDRIVYLGNYLGAHSQWTGEGLSVIGELIAFRNALIAIPGFMAEDLVFLRGRLEDLALELWRLPFHTSPSRWAATALEKGLEGYLSAYGMAVPDLISTSRDGVLAANAFAQVWRKRMIAQKGHEEFFAHLMLAAETGTNHPIAFVPEGFDPAVPLLLQHEALRQDKDSITHINRYGRYLRVIRGTGKASDNNGFVLTLDGGDGLDGMIQAACLDPEGQIIEHLTF